MMPLWFRSGLQLYACLVRLAFVHECFLDAHGMYVEAGRKCRRSSFCVQLARFILPCRMNVSWAFVVCVLSLAVSTGMAHSVRRQFLCYAHDAFTYFSLSFCALL